MIYDPKRKYPSVEPRESPRGRRLDGSRRMAFADGRCVQCGQPYRMGDQIVVNLATAGSPHSEGQDAAWHLDCWNETHADG